MPVPFQKSYKARVNTLRSPAIQFDFISTISQTDYRSLPLYLGRTPVNIPKA